VSAVAKLFRRTVSLLAKKDVAATTATVAPTVRPSQNGRIGCLVMLRTSKSRDGYNAAFRLTETYKRAKTYKRECGNSIALPAARCG
jgi:hypothetical protein